MLRNVKDIEGYAIRATDGDIGHVKGFYFDDKAWARAASLCVSSYRLPASRR